MPVIRKTVTGRCTRFSFASITTRIAILSTLRPDSENLNKIGAQFRSGQHDVKSVNGNTCGMRLLFD